MSKEDFILSAELREESGKGASRRLRRLANLVPAIVYGESTPLQISLKENEFKKHLDNEAFYSHVITLNVGDKTEQVILKDLQRHPAKGHAMHADFLRVSSTKTFQTKVPLHFINENKSKGVKIQGGKVQHSLTELEITCLPGDLPEFIEVDLIDVEVGKTIHISDLSLPKGVESVALAHGSDHDLPVVSVFVPRGMDDDSEEGEATEGGEA